MDRADREWLLAHSPGTRVIHAGRYDAAQAALPEDGIAVGYDSGDIDALVDGTMKQQRLLATAPKVVTPSRPSSPMIWP